MNIKKAVITAAGPDQRHLPLQTIVSMSGKTQTALSQLLEELFEAGIVSVAVVVAAGDEALYSDAAGDYRDQVTFIPQDSPRGYGHAVLCAKEFLNKEDFLLLVSDHLYLSHGKRSCVQQLLDVAQSQKSSVSSVQATHESQLPFYGAIGASRITGETGLYEIETVLEKPTPTLAEQELVVPGLRSAQYLCFFGIHALSYEAIEFLSEQSQQLDQDSTLGLTETLQHLARSTKFLAYEVNGRRFNIAEDYGLLIAQLALALSGPKRDNILSSLVELLASTRR